MYVIDKSNDSDGEHGHFLNAVLDQLQEVKYKEGTLKKKAPTVGEEDSKPLAEDNRVVMIKNDNLLKMNVPPFKQDLKLQKLNQLGLNNIFKYDLHK